MDSSRKTSFQQKLFYPTMVMGNEELGIFNNVKKENPGLLKEWDDVWF